MQIPSGFFGFIKNQVNLNDRLREIADLLDNHAGRIHQLEIDLARQSENLKQMPIALELLLHKSGVLKLPDASE